MKTVFFYCVCVCGLLFLLTGSRLRHSGFSVRDTGKSLEYTWEDRPVFTYQYAMVYPPAGIDTVYKRSGFIHPLQTLRGDTLTHLSPADHYHHFGLWYAWTKTTFEGQEIDFWNLNKKQGTVRFRCFDKISKNGFKACLEHVVYPDSSAEKVAMNESLEITMGATGSEGYFLDYKTVLRCAGTSPVTLEAYRYGGLVVRVREDWNDKTAQMLTSDGHARDGADGSRARWCYFQGKTGDKESCMLIVSLPSNLNHPEPLRVWDKTVNAPCGDVMWNFSPTKESAYVLYPGKSLDLSYRIYVLDGKIDAVTAEKLYRQTIRSFQK